MKLQLFFLFQLSKEKQGNKTFVASPKNKKTDGVNIWGCWWCSGDNGANFFYQNGFEVLRSWVVKGGLRLVFEWSNGVFGFFRVGVRLLVVGSLDFGVGEENVKRVFCFLFVPPGLCTRQPEANQFYVACKWLARARYKTAHGGPWV